MVEGNTIKSGIFVFQYHADIIVHFNCIDFGVNDLLVRLLLKLFF